MTEEPSRHDNRRPLSRVMIQYAFADIASYIDKKLRLELKDILYRNGSIISGRKLKQAVRSEFRGLENDIDYALRSKTSSINRNITKALLLSHPPIVTSTQHYISNISNGFTTSDIANIIEADTDTVSKRIYEFRTKAREKILVQNSHSRKLLRIHNVHIGGNAKFRWSVIFEDLNQYKEEKLLYVVVSLDIERFDWKSFYKMEGEHDVLNAINTWDPPIFQQNVRGGPFIDLLCIYETHTAWTRYYQELGEYIKIFESRSVEPQRRFEADL